MIYIAVILGIIGAPLLLYSAATNKRNRNIFVISILLVGTAIVLFFLIALY